MPISSHAITSSEVLVRKLSENVLHQNEKGKLRKREKSRMKWKLNTEQKEESYIKISTVGQENNCIRLQQPSSRRKVIERGVGGAENR